MHPASSFVERGRSAAAGNRITSRLFDRPLPSGRAVVGGLLVAGSIVGVYAAANLHGDGRTWVLVAGRDLPAGTVLQNSDLARTPVQLPGPQLQMSVIDPAEATGRALNVSVRSGQMLMGSELVAPQTAPVRHSVSLRIPAEQALGGSVRAGDTVSVLATFDACTQTVVESAAVESVDAGHDGLGGSSAVTLTLDVDRAEQVLAVAHAAQAAKVTVVRGAAGGGSTICSPAPQGAAGAGRG